MSETTFPSLPDQELQSNLASLKIYAQVLGKIRRALTPRQKHWWHVSLRTAATGLTTTPIPAGSTTFELLLDLTIHQLVITTNRGERLHKLLHGQSAAAFCADTLGALSYLGIQPQIDRSLFESDDPVKYEPSAISRYWQALAQIDSLLKQFRGELHEETGPVQLWPHNMDLALLWFSGRHVPDTGPDDEEKADEQMNFGFEPGDSLIPRPYFYITAYPTPNGLVGTPLPGDAYWHTEGFTGAVLLYDSLLAADNAAEKLLDFLRTVHRNGVDLMQKSSESRME